MLIQLTIQNFGLIDNIAIEFDKQLNILTGETGAGKSILIGALRIALGERLSSSQIRDKNKPCFIEAVFQITNPELQHSAIFHDFLSEDDNTLIIQRTYTEKNKNKIKINGLNVTVTQLKEIGNHLVDFHGPHDHQMLLSSDSHKSMLDRLVNFDEVLSKYQKTYTQYIELRTQYEKLQSLASSRERELDFLSHQIKELEHISFNETEYKELLDEQKKINNAEKLSECIQNINTVLDSDSANVGEYIRQAFTPMKQLNHIDENTSALMETLNQLQETHEQLMTELHDYANGLSFDPQEANQINAKCDFYDDIKRKYGPTLKDAENFYQSAQEKYNTLINFEQEDNDLKNKIQTLEKKLKEYAQKITQKRQKSSDNLKIIIEKELEELGIANIHFETRIEKSHFIEDGWDIITFYISPNIGEELKPLAEIVSSGEAARVMLALKKALIKVDPIPTLIFDEIDAQIGGRLGTIIGEKLREISQQRQVILITHLPQIASFANIHFKILKKVHNKRTITTVNQLTKPERIKEIAKMMSGEKETAISIKHANDLLKQARIKV